MPKITPPNETLAQVRSQIPQPSVAEWKERIGRAPLAYLLAQVSQLEYNEALPHTPIHLREALYQLIAEAKGRNETVPRVVVAPPVLPPSDETEYERVESGAGKGATVRVPKKWAS